MVQTRRKVLASLGAIGGTTLAGCTGSTKSGGGSTDTATGSGGNGSSPTTLTMATTSSDSAAYQMTQGMASMFKKKSDTINLQAETAAGSQQSMRRMDNGELDLAYTSTREGVKIKEGMDIYKENPFDHDIYQLWHFYDVQYALVSAEKYGIKSVMDLPNAKAIAPLDQGSAARDALLDCVNTAVDTSKIKKLSIKKSEMGQALRSGQAEAVTHVSLNLDVLPSYTEQLYNLNPDALALSWPDEAVQKIKDDPMLTASMYPADKVKGPKVQGDSTLLPELVYVAFTTGRLGEDIVYEFMKTMWENMDAMTQYHGLIKYWSNKKFFSKLSNGIPVHPGAKKFYSEIGVEV